MKRLLIALALLLFALPAQAEDLLAWSGTMMIGGGTPAGGGACTSPATGDLLNEGFEGTGYENIWTEPVGNPDPDATPPGGFAPTGGCSHAFRSNTSSTTLDYATYDFGSEKATLYIKLSFYVDTESIAAWNGINILSANSTNDVDGDALKVTIGHQSGGGFVLTASTSGGDTAAQAIAVDTKYDIVVTKMSDGGASSSSITINGGAPITFNSGYVGVRYMSIGRTNNTETQSLDIYIDVIQVDDDGTFDSP